MARIRDLGWWYWFVTVGLLGAGLFGWPAGIFVAMAIVRRSARSCDLAHARRHCLCRAGTGCVSCDADLGIVGTVAVDSLDPTGRNHGADAVRLLPAGANSVVGAMESLAVIVVRANPTDVPLASGGRAVLRGHVSSYVARAGAAMNWEFSAGMPTGFCFGNSPIHPTRRSHHVTGNHQRSHQRRQCGSTGWNDPDRAGKHDPGDLPIPREKSMDNGRAQPLDIQSFYGAGQEDTSRRNLSCSMPTNRRCCSAPIKERIPRSLCCTPLQQVSRPRSCTTRQHEAFISSLWNPRWKEISTYKDFSGCLTRSGEATRKSVSTLQSSRTRLQNS